MRDLRGTVRGLSEPVGGRGVAPAASQALDAIHEIPFKRLFDMLAEAERTRALRRLCDGAGRPSCSGRTDDRQTEYGYRRDAWRRREATPRDNVVCPGSMPRLQLRAPYGRAPPPRVRRARCRITATAARLRATLCRRAGEVVMFVRMRGRTC